MQGNITKLQTIVVIRRHREANGTNILNVVDQLIKNRPAETMKLFHNWIIL